MAPRKIPGPPKLQDESEEGFMSTLKDLMDDDPAGGGGGGGDGGGHGPNSIPPLNTGDIPHVAEDDMQQLTEAIESVYPFLVRGASPTEEARIRSVSVTSESINSARGMNSSRQASSTVTASGSRQSTTAGSDMSFSTASSPGGGPPQAAEPPNNNSGIAPTKRVLEALGEMDYTQLYDYAVIVTTLLQQQIFIDKHRRMLQEHIGPHTDDDNSRANSAMSFSASMRSFMRPALRETRTVLKKEDDEGSWLNNYLILSEIGKGAYGKVLLALNTATGDPVAIKSMERSLSKQDQSVARREIAVMKKLRHKNVVPLLEVLDDPQKSKVYLVMQYIENGPLVKLEKSLICTTLAEDVASRYLRQLLSGLGYLHNHDIIHRDIKPDNILIDKDGTPYLVDFGVSDIVSAKKEVKGFEGTAYFLAPEMFGGAKNYKGPPTDVWALGVTFFAAVVGTLPFKGKNISEIEDAITTGQPKFPSHLSAKWKEVLSAMLTKDPAKRATIKELKAMRLFATDAAGDAPGAFKYNVTAEEEAQCIGLVQNSSGSHAGESPGTSGRLPPAGRAGGAAAAAAANDDDVHVASAEFVEMALASMPAQAQSRLRRVLNNARQRAQQAWAPSPQPPDGPRPPSGTGRSPAPGAGPSNNGLRQTQSMPIPPITRSSSSRRMGRNGDDDAPATNMLNSFSHNSSPKGPLGGASALPAIGSSPRGSVTPRVLAGAPTGKKPLGGRMR